MTPEGCRHMKTRRRGGQKPEEPEKERGRVEVDHSHADYGGCVFRRRLAAVLWLPDLLVIQCSQLGHAVGYGCVSLSWIL